MLEAAGFPVAVNPEAKLAAIARRRGWPIEHWERAAGGPRRRWPSRPGVPACRRRRRAGSRPPRRSALLGQRTDGRRDEGPAVRAEPATASPRHGSPRRVVGSGKRSPGRAARAGRDRRARSCRVRAGCGSGPGWRGSAARTSRHWTVAAPATSSTSSASPSFPATRSSATPRAGHWPAGESSSSRCSVVRRARHQPAVPDCARRAQRRLRADRLRPPASWTADRVLRRHRRGLVRRARRAREPAARGSRSTSPTKPPSWSSRQRARCTPRAQPTSPAASGSIVLGAGTLGLCVIAALRALCLPGALVAVAKHPHQRTLARELGADQVVVPGESSEPPRRLSGSLALESARRGDRPAHRRRRPRLRLRRKLASSLDQCLDVVRPGGRDRARRHAGRRAGRPRSALAARDRAARRLRLRHRGPAGGAPADLRPRHGARRARPTSSVSSRPATRSSDTRRPCATPPPPDAAERSRSSSTCAEARWDGRRAAGASRGRTRT